MSKKTIIAIALVAGISTVALSSNAFAYHGNNGNGYAGCTAAQVPALTAEQKTALETLRTQFEAAIAPIQKQLTVKQAEYAALMAQTNPDPATAGKMAGELSDIRQQLFEASKVHRDNVAEALGIDPATYVGHMGMGMMGMNGMGHDNMHGSMRQNYGNSGQMPMMGGRR